MNAAGTRGTRASANPLSMVHNFVWSSADLQEAVSAKALEPTVKFFMGLMAFCDGVGILFSNILFLFDRADKQGFPKSNRLAKPTKYK